MNVTAREVYETMFLVLDAAWDEERSEALGRYLSDANPFLWEDGRSADPAIWSDFERRFMGAFPQGCSDTSASWAFISAYLLDMGAEYRAMVQEDDSCQAEDFPDVFSRIAPMDAWVSALRRNGA